jgi:hypothetical protein
MKTNDCARLTQHSGTNFGFMSGANMDGAVFQPIITSYDYNAPIAEDGSDNVGSDGRNKYAGIQRLLRGSIVPQPSPDVRAYGSAVFTAGAWLLSHLAPLTAGRWPVLNQTLPLPMEKVCVCAYVCVVASVRNSSVVF